MRSSRVFLYFQTWFSWGVKIITLFYFHCRESFYIQIFVLDDQIQIELIAEIFYVKGEDIF